LKRSGKRENRTGTLITKASVIGARERCKKGKKEKKKRKKGGRFIGSVAVDVEGLWHLGA